MKKYHIVFTTIYHPLVLNDIYENVVKFGHLNDVCIWIVGDRKTPETINFLVEEVNRNGLEVEYLSIDKQKESRKIYEDFYDILPFDNETRRNLGYLKALEHGCEVLISIDDDNFPVTENDFIGSHSETGSLWNKELISEGSGYHNICEHLVFEPQRDIYPRGFPFNLRGQKNENNIEKKENVFIGVNAGLWIIEPDIDATTWLNGKVISKKYIGNHKNVLSQDTWTPINTQNTSVVRELIPAYLCIPMGHEVPGGRIGRYGDIWGGYFLQALMKGTKYNVSFGNPIVEHRRNPHNYVDDLRHEYWGMIMTDWLLEILKNKFQAKSNSMTDRMRELADFIDEETKNNLPKWCPMEMVDFMGKTTKNLKYWASACDRIL